MSNPQRLIILHSSDLHGESEALARIGTLVAKTHQQNPGVPVLYLDSGDSQDKSGWLSKKTRGAGMYALLAQAGCQASVMSNKNIKRYGVEIVQTYAEAGGFPILNSNIFLPDGEPLPGTQPSMLLDTGVCRLGIIGVTADGPRYVRHYGLKVKSFKKRIRREMAALHEAGADACIVLSHVGMRDDRRAARAFSDSLPLILGGHSHGAHRQGKWEDGVAISHVGAYGHYLGRIDLLWQDGQLQVTDLQLLPVTLDIPLHPPCADYINAQRPD